MQVRGYWNVVDLYKAIYEVMNFPLERRVDFNILPSRLVVSLKLKTPIIEEDTIRDCWYGIIDRVLPRSMYVFYADCYMSERFEYLETISFVISGVVKKKIVCPILYIQ